MRRCKGYEPSFLILTTFPLTVPFFLVFGGPSPRTPLPDERIEFLFKLVDPVKHTPAFLEVR